ncbi:hypothetical protein ACGFNU_25835 [Spirillospora sp. NPDC048911]|uniref:hypothetical protein n=1 Tax=Spirillospora sp. NPDC048911 TaxID=3364527 RepID=UPI003715DCE5
MKHWSYNDPHRFHKESFDRFKDQWARDDWERRQAGGVRQVLVVVLLVVGLLLVARHQGYSPAGLWARVELWLNG